MIYYSFDIGSSEWERETTSLGWDARFSPLSPVVGYCAAYCKYISSETVGVALNGLV